MKPHKIRVRTIICPKCGIEMYSRSLHDCRICGCGTMIDGGFEYIRYGWPQGYTKPTIKTRYIYAAREELYNDWNMRRDEFGIIKGAK